MSANFPQLVDPWQAAAAGDRISGSFMLADSVCLADRLVWPKADEEGRENALGIVSFEAVFGRDGQGRPCIDLHVEARVPLRCQRTLKIFTESLSSDSRIVVVRDDAEAERVDAELEPYLLTGKQLALRQLVEEEVLLALPLVPLDPASEPVAPPEDSGPVVREERQKPFAGLAGLLHGGPARDSGNADEEAE